MNDGRREILLCWEVVVDARALDAHIRGDFPEAEAAETTLLHAPFGSIHDQPSRHSWSLSYDYLLIDSPCLLKTQRVSAYLPIESSAGLWYRARDPPTARRKPCRSYGTSFRSRRRECSVHTCSNPAPPLSRAAVSRPLRHPPFQAVYL